MCWIFADDLKIVAPYRFGVMILHKRVKKDRRAPSTRSEQIFNEKCHDILKLELCIHTHICVHTVMDPTGTENLACDGFQLNMGYLPS
jgi:hypothetical protein